MEEYFRVTGVGRWIDLEVRRNGQPVKERVYHTVARMGKSSGLGVYNNDVAAVERALLERYFLCKVGEDFLPALGTRAVVWKRSSLTNFRRAVVERVRPNATVCTRLEVVQSYTGPKRRIYENAYRSLMRSRVNIKDASLRPFTKFEKQDLVKAPRIINPRSPRYNLELGRFLKRSEKLFYKAINEVWGECTDHTVIKGLNSFDAAKVLKAKWDRFKDPVAVGLDAIKYDMHVGEHHLGYEHSFYKEVFADVPQFRLLCQLLQWQILNKGKAFCPDGVVEFLIRGTRCSGDINTSLGNCILMCALIWALMTELGIDAELANNGDDCVLIFERHRLLLFLEMAPVWFHEFGFRMEIEEPVFEFEHIEFCQSQPVLLPGGWCMVRNVRTCLRKDPMCLIPVQNESVWRRWLWAVGECGLASVPGCPILQSFYRCMMRNGQRASLKFKQHIFKHTGALERRSGLDARVDSISAETRASFAIAFGISPDYQIAMERYYDEFEIQGWGDMEDGDSMAETRAPAFVWHL